MLSIYFVFSFIIWAIVASHEIVSMSKHKIIIILPLLCAIFWPVFVIWFILLFINYIISEIKLKTREKKYKFKNN